ncbi:hypothetical protein QQ045_030341 [Rhodiola kirilowii]
MITDNILVAHEVSHFIKCRSNQKTGYLSLKLNLSKAYDRVEWKFLEKMMIKLGFAESWVRKIMMCISTVTYKVKTNDSISELIEPERALRQGDPISPYLFLICAEWLTHAIDRARRFRYIEGISICKNAPVVIHLMFADDCLIFLKAKKEALVHVRKLLNDYELVSG